MKLSAKKIRLGIEKLKTRIGVDGLFREFGNDLPLRSELFSVAQLEQHAEALAEWHLVDPRHGPDRLLARLADNEQILLEAYKLVADAVGHNRNISPASEWLLDNFYLIEEQIRTARRHLPKGYSRGLPRLLNGPSAGYPCVYDLALELISHVDGRIDAETLRSFVSAYQRGRKLKLGELWAIPIMMRQALIENLRRVAARVATGTLDRATASKWADLFIEVAEKNPKNLILVVADMARPNPPLPSMFVAEMARRLQGQSPALAFPLTWIEQQLLEHGQTIEQMVQSEAQQQAVHQVSIGNSISSLRELEAIDWREFVEDLSIVEQTLLGDPAGVYGGMDFSTRDEYRHVIERISKRSSLTEQEVANQAVQLARHNAGHNERTAHVGYFLIDKGLPELERATRMRRSVSARVGRLARKVPLTLYVGAILFVAAAVTTGVLWQIGIDVAAASALKPEAQAKLLANRASHAPFDDALPPQRGSTMPAQGNALGHESPLTSEALKGRNYAPSSNQVSPLQGLESSSPSPTQGDALGWHSAAPLGRNRTNESSLALQASSHLFAPTADAKRALCWLAALLLFVGASHLAVGLVNWLATMFVRPHRLPRMDFSKGIPPEFSTLVTVPTMLISPRNVDRLIEALEVRYLANRDDNLRFCLLTDFRDAAQQTMPEDESLLQLAQAGIESLNEKYRGYRSNDAEGDIFFLLHRPRRWNPQEQTWMGHERKRGKLRDLNALLLGGSGEAFSLIVGEASQLIGMKYVITLDTDTLLPRDAARQLVGTMAHVLNQAQIDKKRKVVVEGYGILQPGVAILLDAAGPSWLVRLCAGEPGIDPYTRAISDVYQDVFHQGSFIGKGIYDVAAFSETMEQRFPENQILSHDLLEGCYARSGLITDVHVFESYPSRYNTDVSRRHRWMRGDWQIAGWLLPLISGPDGRSVRNPISWLSVWKFFDNLRRSVVPCALPLLLLIGWLVLPPAWLWTAVVVGIVLIPAVCLSLVALFRKAEELPLVPHLRHVGKSLAVSLAQATLTIVFLPYEAFFSLDAIVRTAVRMLFTHKRMLEWKTASDAEREGSGDLVGCYRTMWIAPLIAIMAIVALALTRPDALWAAAPMLVLWMLSPLIAWKISQPALRQESKLTQLQTLFLHQVARKTWRFFEKFVGPEDHWLPPDNFQEYPAATIAHRTSPTNLGMSLLANLGAYDFGYITAGQLLDRTTNTMRSMDHLERFHGHFLNWYDTQTRQPLLPKYVSSVDSGNLAGHLLPLRRGLLELSDHKLVSSRLWQSFAVTLQALESHSQASRRASAPGHPRDNAQVRGLTPTGSPSHVEKVLELLHRASSSRLSTTQVLLQELLTAAANAVHDSVDADHRGLLRDLEQQCRDHLAELMFIAPWLGHPPASQDLWQRGPPEQVQRLRELQEMRHRLDEMPTLRNVADIERELLPTLDVILSNITDEPETFATACSLKPEAQAKFGSQEALLALQVSTAATGDANEASLARCDVAVPPQRGSNMSAQGNALGIESSLARCDVAVPPQRGSNMSAQGNALGSEFHVTSEALKGRAYVPSADLVSPLQGFESSLKTPTQGDALGWHSAAPLGRSCKSATSESEHHDSTADAEWLGQLRALLHSASQRANERLLSIDQRATQCGDMANIEYDFLFCKSRRLLAIGYNVSERRRDASFYDLLASEARLASFVAIAQGELEQEHWFALGRLLTTSNGQQMLLSWSGSMFEYLMPLLVMPSYENTLLDQTYQAVIDRQSNTAGSEASRGAFRSLATTRPTRS